MNRPEPIEFAVRSGGRASGEIALPEGSTAGPAVVLLHEWWGLNDHIRSIMTRLAEAGFLVVVPDLFHGKSTKNADEAGALMNGLDWKQAMSEISGAAEAARTHARSTGKVAVMGFCMGGALTFAAGCNVEGLSAIVPFYGVPKEADWSKLEAPVSAHFASKDGWAKPEAARAIEEKVIARGGKMELHVYDADHAFFNDTRPEVYSRENAALAWDRTVAFLKAHLASG